VHIARNLRDIAFSSYYRRRPIAAGKYIYAKWRYRRSRVSAPGEMLEALGIDPQDGIRGYEKWRPCLEAAWERVNHAAGQHGAVSIADGMVLFGLARALRPNVVIETGVAAGISSSFIGAALAENGHGVLYSVELPTALGQSHSSPDGSRYDWPSVGPGWAVPSEVRSALGQRNVLLLGDVRDVLPRLLDEVGRVDLFFHDDLHLPEHVLWEFGLVWPRLRPGGTLVADDADFGWFKFTKLNRLPRSSLLNLDRLVAVRKPGL
jgi:hypothetical protein